MEGGLSPRPEIEAREREREIQRVEAEAMEAEAVQGATQGEGRKRSALERSPARFHSLTYTPGGALEKPGSGRFSSLVLDDLGGALATAYRR